jgi:SAM-dependent methyltransferase
VQWNDVADAYIDVVEDRQRILLPAITKLVAEKHARRVADVGGGDGRFLEALLAWFGEGYFSQVALTDPSVRMREHARRRLGGEANIHPSPHDLEGRSWDCVMLIAVWMGLESEEECVTVLRDAGALLARGGRLIAGVTHPCFRDRSFHTYTTNFDMSDYLKGGTPFRVTLYDSRRSLELVDTHWSLTDHMRQLRSAGLVLESLEELADVGPSSPGSPWLVLTAKRG